jgi:serine protease Do
LRCPNCSSKITSRVQCNNCGLLFARYSMAQDRKKAELVAKAAKNAGIRRILSLALIVLLFVAIGGTGYYFFGRQKSAPQMTQNIPAQPTQKTPPQIAQKIPAPATTPSVSQSPAKEAPTTENEQKKATKDKVTLGSARQTIVSIDTPWGACTGFFIRKNMIVTSKYMVEYNSERYEEYVNEVNQSRELLEQEAQKLQEQKAIYGKMDYGAPKDELLTEIEKREERLNSALLKQQEREDRLKDKATIIKDPKIVLYLPNGDVVEMINMAISKVYDLALISVDNTDAPSIELPPEETSLTAGDTLYSLGPGNKAIKGSFTQFHKGNGPTQNYLQTDAQISPKYSGAPLIDEKGYVYGVSTTTLVNEDGIGSAIPIATVFSEFSL